MASRSVYSDTKIRVKASKLQAQTQYSIQINNISTGESKNMLQRTVGGSLTRTVEFPSGGVVETIIKDPKGRIAKRTVNIGTAEIDCCIAKLVHDAINCTCKCNKCNEDLKRAETIYLLLQSAKHEAHVLGNVQMAADKVNKAKQMCDEVCACGC